MKITDINQGAFDREQAVNAVIAAAHDKAFQWGAHDCCTFAASVVQARTGANPLDGLTWTSEEEATALIASLGGFAKALTDRLGPPIAALLARTGDIVLARDEGRELVAVCHGAFLIAPGTRGLAILPLDAGLKAWRNG